ncbi:MAG TPA: hypothetical protein VMM15_32150, partial [Bradyrhizobium sp.]|nr:hypothetical protein [Bradyrhizobium sp.]
VGQALVGEDRSTGIERLGRQRGAQDVEAVESRFGSDRRLVADEAEGLPADGEMYRFRRDRTVVRFGRASPSL